MFVFESKNYETLNIDSITCKNVIELCAAVLNYNNNKIIQNDKKTDYTVKFIDNRGNIIREMSESG
jgi:hypothetical protein